MPASDAPTISEPLRDVVTARLDLRRFEAGDLDELAGLFSHPEVWRFPFGRGLSSAETATFLENQIDHWTEHRFGLWCARQLSDGRIIGFVGLSVPTFLPEILPAVEVGWRFAPAAWGHGYATEGGTAALDEAFSSLGLERVFSIPEADNRASAQVAERLGMELIREVTIPPNERRVELRGLVYEISRDDWLRLRR